MKMVLSEISQLYRRLVNGFLSENDPMTLLAGRYDLGADGAFVLVQEYETKCGSVFEAHRKYIDIQCVVSGQEYIYVCDIHDAKGRLADYDEVKDVEFFASASECTRILADSDNPVVLFPCDAHQPCMSVDGISSHVRKLVFKIPVNCI